MAHKIIQSLRLTNLIQKKNELNTNLVCMRINHKILLINNMFDPISVFLLQYFERDIKINIECVETLQI